MCIINAEKFLWRIFFFVIVCTNIFLKRMNIPDKLATLKKLIKDMKDTGQDSLLNDLILLSAIAEMKMKSNDTVENGELEMKIDEAIKTLKSINQLKL